MVVPTVFGRVLTRKRGFCWFVDFCVEVLDDMPVNRRQSEAEILFPGEVTPVSHCGWLSGQLKSTVCLSADR